MFDSLIAIPNLLVHQKGLRKKASEKGIIPGTFLTYLSSVPTQFIPKGGPHSSSVSQHGLYGQRWRTRIDRTFGLCRIHGFLDPTFKETSQIATYKLVIL